MMIEVLTISCNMSFLFFAHPAFENVCSASIFFCCSSCQFAIVNGVVVIIVVGTVNIYAQAIVCPDFNLYYGFGFTNINNIVLAFQIDIAL